MTRRPWNGNVSLHKRVMWPKERIHAEKMKADVEKRGQGSRLDSVYLLFRLPEWVCLFLCTPICMKLQEVKPDLIRHGASFINHAYAQCCAHWKLISTKLILCSCAWDCAYVQNHTWPCVQHRHTLSDPVVLIRANRFITQSTMCALQIDCHWLFKKIICSKMK